jgi:hypothetical protein
MVDLIERIDALLQQETKLYNDKSDYMSPWFQQNQLSSSTTPRSTAEINEKWREVMCEWCFRGTTTTALPLSSGHWDLGFVTSFRSFLIFVFLTCLSLLRCALSMLFPHTVVDHFQLNRETVTIAMYYLDRYLGSHVVDKKKFQLAAMTSLYLANKVCGYQNKIC